MVNRTKYFLIFIALLFLLSIVRIWLRSSNFLDQVLSYIAYPVLVTEHMLVTPLKAVWKKQESSSELEVLLAEYRLKHEALQAQNIQLQELIKFNEETKELVRFARTYNTEHAICGQILFKQLDDTNHFFLVDAGHKKHVKPNMIAVYKNCLVGKVSEVYPYYSKVVLITDRSCKVAAHCSITGIKGINQGQNSLRRMQLLFVNHLATIAQDELVISSGEGLVFPRGYCLGKIKHVQCNEFQYNIAVEPVVNLEELNYCYILEKGSTLS